SRPRTGLSDREQQVLHHLASGRTVSEAAASLGLSVKTVSTYRARLLGKLGLETNAALMRFALDEGLVV
ncbi:MAG: response regulator transcription factor, partial [Acidobacteriota bacterium]